MTHSKLIYRIKLVVKKVVKPRIKLLPLNFKETPKNNFQELSYRKVIGEGAEDVATNGVRA